ncbi:MAG: TetR/AcrR family transcriptional regulator [Firmicutes bacterium]|jgi:AcrR family transcriptional regulator|nr:TetR/AcrR family transcriptional regulator [Bacillota bacterium]
MDKTQEEKILDAAYHCIAKDGYARTSLRQIAQEAGVAVSQISYHYTNKEGLLLAVVARAAQNYHEYMKGFMKEGMTPQEKGEQFITLFQEVLQTDPELFRVLYDLAGLALWSEPFRDRVRDVFAGITEQITTEVFDADVLAELGNEYSAKTLASMLFGGLFGIAIQALLEPEDVSIRNSLSALSVIFQK